jgi:hypothetical protein
MQKIVQFWKSGTVGKIVVIVGLLLLVCICCSAFSLISTSSPTYKATATARAAVRAPELAKPANTLSPTETPMPTNTPGTIATLRPTDTPASTNTLAPTETPEPSKTPSSTNTPEPTSTPEFTSAEETYKADVVEITAQYADAFTDFSELATAAGEDSSLLADDDWKLEMVVVLVTMRSLNEEVRALDPPGRFADVHDDLLDAVEHYDQFITLFTTGVDTLDVEKINQAGEELLLGNEAIGEATEKIKEIGD